MRRSLISLALLLVVALLAACSAPAPTATPTTAPTVAPTVQPAPTTAPTTAATAAPTTGTASGALPAVDPAALSGTISLAGSSTVYPLAEAIAARFEDEGFGGEITIASIGSGAGFERFCKTGETDIATASRKIKDSEVQSCAGVNRKPIELRVGTDGLAVVVSKDNTFITNATMEELAKIFSNAATNWSDVNSAWPNEPIRRFIPGTDSGTFDYFVEVVLKNDKAPALAAANLQASEDDNVLVQGVQGSPYAIGYFGYAYYAENAGQLKVLSVNGVTPSADTVESGKYPLSRPLFLYSDATLMKSRPQVAGFLNYFLTHVNEEIADVGYFPASDAALAQARAAWLAAMK